MAGKRECVKKTNKRTSKKVCFHNSRERLWDVISQATTRAGSAWIADYSVKESKKKKRKIRKSVSISVGKQIFYSINMRKVRIQTEFQQHEPVKHKKCLERLLTKSTMNSVSLLHANWQLLFKYIKHVHNIDWADVSGTACHGEEMQFNALITGQFDFTTPTEYVCVCVLQILVLLKSREYIQSLRLALCPTEKIPILETCKAFTNIFYGAKKYRSKIPKVVNCSVGWLDITFISYSSSFS